MSVHLRHEPKIFGLAKCDSDALRKQIENLYRKMVGEENITRVLQLGKLMAICGEELQRRGEL